VKKSGLLFLFFLLFLCPFTRAQSAISLSEDVFMALQQTNNGEGKVLIHQDPRISELVNRHILRNKRSGGIDGYRIRIFSDIGPRARQASDETKARFFEIFPEIDIYREYDSPYFKVYVGDYRTKNEAIKDFKRIRRYFPAAFIVPDKINYPDFENE